MKNILFFFIIFSSFGNEDAFKRVQQNCFDNIDWSKKKCEFTDKNVGWYDWVGGHNTFMMGTMGSFVSGVVTGVQGAYDILTLGKSEGSKKRNRMIELVKSKIEGTKISTCQKACLSQCVSSNYIDYKSAGA